MKKSIFICIAICLTVLVTSCGEELDDKYEYLAIKSEISVSESSLSVEGTENTYKIQVNSNSYWTASTNTNWIHLNSSGGKGKGSLSLTVESNPSAITERKGDISVTDGITVLKISIIQNPALVSISVSPSSLTPPYKGASYSVKVESNFDWTVSSNAKWCTLSTTSTGITVNVQANNSYSPRTATITVVSAGVTTPIVVSQSAPKEPTLGDITVSDVTKTTARCSFSYESSDLSIINCGVCYSSTNTVPTTSDTLKDDPSISSNSGTAMLDLSELTQNTTYYIRPYVETSVGTTYGNTISFKTASGTPDENDNPTPNY